MCADKRLFLIETQMFEMTQMQVFFNGNGFELQMFETKLKSSVLKKSNATDLFEISLLPGHYSMI